MSVRLWCSLAALVAYLPASSPSVLADEVGTSTGASADPALLVVPFCAAFGLGFPLWGRVADRRERFGVMAAALGLLAAAGALLAAADGTAAVVAARALQGLAAAGVPPAAQAALTAASGDAKAGRAVGAMMVGVAVATLGGPAIAALVAGAAGWRTAVAVLFVAAPAAAAVALARTARTAPSPAPARLAAAAPLVVTRGLVAGWAVSALVLGGYWTVLTRLGVVLGEDGLAASDALAALTPLAGAAGIPLVLLAGRAADARGPRRPMVLTLGPGAVALAVAAAAPGPAAFALAAAVALALYWAYLPVVSVQVQRSAPVAARGRAVGVLYAAMWVGAALAGGAAALVPGWRGVLAGAALLWAAAALVAATGFLRAPHSVAWRPSTTRAPLEPRRSPA